MNKKLKSIVTLATCSLMSLNIVLQTASAAMPQKIVGLDTFTELKDDRTHIYNVRETSDWLVRNNTTDYVLVIPENSRTYEKTGAEDFATLFRAATGATLRIVTDDKYGEWTENSKIISYGLTSFLEDANVDNSNELLSACGFIIKTVGKSIFITGGENDMQKGWGTMFGGYKLLNLLVGFEQYGADVEYYEKVDNLKLYKYDVFDVPDFKFRKGPNDFVHVGKSIQEFRMGYTDWSQFITVPGYGFGHSSFGFVEPELYAESHPEWFNGSLTQLCLTAGGDEASRQEMLDVAAENLIEFVMSEPDGEYIAIAQQDDPNYAYYDKVYADEHYGGAISGLWVRFCNELSDRLEAYFEANNIERTVNIVFYSYVYTEQPPVAMGDDGKFYPIIECKDNVIPLYCPIFQHQTDSVVSQLNSDVYGYISNWALCSDKTWVWFYNATYYDYMFPRFSTASIQENARYMSSIGCEWYFVQGQSGNDKLWAFGDLTNWLTSKLSWDTSLDQEELTQQFFEHYYQDAAESMMKIYRLMEANYHYHTQNDSLHMGTDGFEYKTTKYWPLAFSNQLLGLIDEAEASIQKYMSADYALYETLRKRIILEKIPFNYAIVELYSNNFTAEYIKNLKKEIKKDCIYIDAIHWKEGTPLSTLWEYWGI